MTTFEIMVLAWPLLVCVLVAAFAWYANPLRCPADDKAQVTHPAE